jgi:UDP-glucuronate 4-epimerase
LDYIEAIEDTLGVKARKDFLPMQPGDVPNTYADIEDLIKDFEYQPSYNLKQGVKNFVLWFKEFHNL